MLVVARPVFLALSLALFAWAVKRIADEYGDIAFSERDLFPSE